MKVDYIKIYFPLPLTLSYYPPSLRFRMSDISIDDMNTTLIQYNGSWQAVINSTKQWDGTVHTTGQAGATATFKFHGKLY